MKKQKDPSIVLPLPSYEGDPRSDIILAALEKIDPSIADRWTPEGRQAICDKLEDVLENTDPTQVEIDIDDIMEAARQQYEEKHSDNELIQKVVNDAADEYIEEEYNDRDLTPAPLVASDYNDYDFRRHVCDLFEVGYHTPTIDLVLLFTAKIDKQLLMIF